MIIYNVTIKTAHSITDEWLNWLKEEHIADVINTGCFTHATVLRLLDIDEEDGITHAVQYHAPDIKLTKNIWKTCRYDAKKRYG
ncbi:MAG: DUF4286 family protein [Chitinophagaceae bacterium]|nr:DUF4286 family protein [Chitinophagaceae bacterium]